MLEPELPHAPTMGASALALIGNAVCLWPLWHRRADDINMRSVWLCSRDDIIANVAVLGAGASVWALRSRWLDVIVGCAIAALFLASAVHVLHEATKEHHSARTDPGPVLVTLESPKDS